MNGCKKKIRKTSLSLIFLSLFFWACGAQDDGRVPNPGQSPVAMTETQDGEEATSGQIVTEESGGDAANQADSSQDDSSPAESPDAPEMSQGNGNPSPPASPQAAPARERALSLEPMAIELVRNHELIVPNASLEGVLGRQSRIYILEQLYGGYFYPDSQGPGTFGVDTRSTVVLPRFSQESRAFAPWEGFSVQNVTFTELLELPMATADVEARVITVFLPWAETTGDTLYLQAREQALSESGQDSGWFGVRNLAIEEGGFRIAYLVWPDFSAGIQP